jgi:hypothetical protein
MTNYITAVPLPPQTVTAITATPQNLAAINMTGMDTLTLDVDFTKVAGTVFIMSVYAAKGLNDSTNSRQYTVRNDSALTFADATYNYTFSASFRKIFTFNLAALGLTASSAGNIIIAVSATNGSTDSATITPQVSRVGG